MTPFEEWLESTGVMTTVADRIVLGECWTAATERAAKIATDVYPENKVAQDIAARIRNQEPQA